MAADRLALQRTALVVSNASKHAFHEKSAQLGLHDIELAAGEPVYGWGGAVLPQLLQVPEADCLCRFEAELSTTQPAQTALPTAPLEVGVAPHWLAIAGVQPATAENAQPKRAATTSQAGPEGRGVAGAPVLSWQAPALGAGNAGHGEVAGGMLAGLPLRHTMPDELHLYYDMVRRTLQSNVGSAEGGALAGQAVAASLATDPGLQPVLPYLVPLLADEVGKNLRNAAQLRLILSGIRGLLSNIHLHLVPYIHHLLPAIMTCLVAKSVATEEEHWTIRNEAAALLGQVARGSQMRKDELAAALARVQQTLATSLFDDAPQTQYGSLVGLTAFGVPVLMHAVIPNLGRYARLLQSNATSQHNIASLHVRAALLVALERCIVWNSGVHAPAILKSMRALDLQGAMHAVLPVTPVHL